MDEIWKSYAEQKKPDKNDSGYMKCMQKANS